MLAQNVNLNIKTVLVTGETGFIGSNLAMELLRTAVDLTNSQSGIKNFICDFGEIIWKTENTA